MSTSTHYGCIRCDATYSLSEPVYACSQCGALLEVRQPEHALEGKTPKQWREQFATGVGSPGPAGSGVWRYHPWLIPELDPQVIVTLGEGNTPLLKATDVVGGVDLYVKQCGHTHTGSFKDLGMTVLVSQVAAMRRQGAAIPAVACASTGDTSAALAAYGAKAGIRTLVLLPKGKISNAQLMQPLAHGARVVAIDGDFDDCMEHVQRLCTEEGVYLANSKNSLRIEGQKTVGLEIAQGLDWSAPDWVIIPSGNLGNVSALVKGFSQARQAGLIDRVPRVIAAQTQRADPLYQAFTRGFDQLQPVKAQDTEASAIRIGNPVSYERAVTALKACNGKVDAVSEEELAQAARQANQKGMYCCPHTAVALASVNRQVASGTIETGQRVVVVSTAHGLKFTEFVQRVVDNTVPGVSLGDAQQPVNVPNEYARIKDAALG